MNALLFFYVAFQSVTAVVQLASEICIAQAVHLIFYSSIQVTASLVFEGRQASASSAPIHANCVPDPLANRLDRVPSTTGEIQSSFPSFLACCYRVTANINFGKDTVTAQRQRGKPFTKRSHVKKRYHGVRSDQP